MTDKGWPRRNGEAKQPPRHRHGLQLACAYLALVAAACLASANSVAPAARTQDHESFYDAPAHPDDDAYEETFYDSESELDYDENSEENSCIAANRHECRHCCDSNALHNPFWNQTVGRCFCYNLFSEENICKASRSAADCATCCAAKHYGRSSYEGSGRQRSACTCCLADESFFRRSFSAGRQSGAD